jgi:hypothetical protein
LVIAGLGFPAIFGFTALSVDMGRVYSAQHELESSADAIAHAALISLRNGHDGDQIHAQLDGFYGENSIDGQSVMAHNMKVSPGHWDFGTQTWTPYAWDDIGYAPINAIEVQGSRLGEQDAIPMFLSPFMGVEMMDIMTLNGAIAAYRATDLMVVLDVTPSFRHEVDVAKEASLSMLELMRNQGIEGNRIGMVTFTGGAELLTPFKDPTRQFSEVYSRWSGNNTVAPYIEDTTCHQDRKANGELIVGSWECTGPQFENDGSTGTAQDPVPVQNTTYKVKRGIGLCSVRELAEDPNGYDPNGWVFKRFGYHNARFLSEDVVPCGKGGGGTNPGSGIDVALDEMVLYGSTANQWEMLLITDGEPYPGGGFQHHTYPEWNNRGYANSKLGIQNYTASVAREACDKGIDMHTIFYSKDESSQGVDYSDYAVWLKNNVLCEDGGSTFAATINIDKLPGLMQKVVQTLPVVIVQ